MGFLAFFVWCYFKTFHFSAYKSGLEFFMEM